MIKSIVLATTATVAIGGLAHLYSSSSAELKSSPAHKINDREMVGPESLSIKPKPPATKPLQASALPSPLPTLAAKASALPTLAVPNALPTNALLKLKKESQNLNDQYEKLSKEVATILNHTDLNRQDLDPKSRKIAISKINQLTLLLGEISKIELAIVKEEGLL